MFDHISLYFYSLKGSFFFNERKGFLLKSSNNDGTHSWAEAPPLPSWSKETLFLAGKQLLELSKKKAPSKLFPSVAFALRCLKLRPGGPLSIPLSALFYGSSQEILKQAHEAKKRGIKSAKIKIGTLSPQVALALLNELKKEFYLRVDCNKKWSLKGALAFFETFPLNAFDYIEEPLHNPQDLPSFSHPFALDESLHKIPAWHSLPKLKTIVLKPTLLENWETLLKERPKKITPVLSSTFDSGVGIFHLAHLADELRLNTPQGFGPYQFLNDDVMNERFLIQNGTIEIPSKLTINPSKLKEIKNESDLMSTL